MQQILTRGPAGREHPRDSPSGRVAEELLTVYLAETSLRPPGQASMQPISVPSQCYHTVSQQHYPSLHLLRHASVHASLGRS